MITVAMKASPRFQNLTPEGFARVAGRFRLLSEPLRLQILNRLREVISINHFMVGMIKAPFMALVIGIVACVRGLDTKGSAESLGMQTTNAVVQSIFLVIVLDGVFAVFFAAIDK